MNQLNSVMELIDYFSDEALEVSCIQYYHCVKAHWYTYHYVKA